MRALAPIAARQRVAKSFVMRGELSGAEYLDVASERDLKLWGVEDKTLYFEAVEAYRAVAAKREFFEATLDKAMMAADSMKGDFYNPALRAFDAKRSDYIKGKTALGDFTQTLFTEAEKTGHPLKYYPSLAELADIKKMEAQVDFAKANEEQKKLLSQLSKEESAEIFGDGMKNGGPAALSGKDVQQLYAFYAVLSEKTGGLTGYPELKKYFEYLGLARSFSARRTLEQLELLENQIYDSYLKTREEKAIHQADENIRHLRSLIGLKMVPSEYREYKRQGAFSEISTIAGLLNRKIADLGDHYERLVFREKDFDAYVKKAERFYELTLERDKKFVQNLKDKMQKEHVTKAALLAGGYHAPNLKELLEEENISYASIQPAVYHETNQKRYEKILFERAQEKHESKTVTIEKTEKWIEPRPIQEAPIAAARLSSALADAGKMTADLSSGARLADAVVRVPGIDADKIDYYRYSHRNFISPEGKYMFVNGTLRETATGVIVPLPLKKEDVMDANFSPTQMILAIDYAGKTAQLIDVESRKVLTFDGLKKVQHFSRFSKDGRYLLAYNRDGTVAIVDFKDKKVFSPVSGQVEYIYFTDDDKLLEVNRKKKGEKYGLTEEYYELLSGRRVEADAGVPSKSQVLPADLAEKTHEFQILGDTVFIQYDIFQIDADAPSSALYERSTGQLTPLPTRGMSLNTTASPDNRHFLIYNSFEGVLNLLFDARTHQIVPIGLGWKDKPFFSADGKRLVVFSGNQITSYDLTTPIPAVAETDSSQLELSDPQTVTVVYQKGLLDIHVKKESSGDEGRMLVEIRFIRQPVSTDQHLLLERRQYNKPEQFRSSVDCMAHFPEA